MPKTESDRIERVVFQPNCPFNRQRSSLQGLSDYALYCRSSRQRSGRSKLKGSDTSTEGETRARATNSQSLFHFCSILIAMSSLKDSWNDAQQKAKSWIASVTGQEPKDYGKMIIGLDTPSLKDQTLILKVRTTYIYSTMVGSLVSTVAAFWACTSTFFRSTIVFLFLPNEL